jgi:hypothetical protein
VLTRRLTLNRTLAAERPPIVASSAAEPLARRRGLLLGAYGLLLASLPILSIAARNRGEYLFGDLVDVLGLWILAFLVVYLAAVALWGQRSEIPGLATTVAAFWAWCYIPVHRWVFEKTGLLASNWVFFPFCSAVSLLLLFRIQRHPALAARLGSMGRVVAALLGGWFVLSVARDTVRERMQAARSPFYHSLLAPVALRPSKPPAPNGTGAVGVNAASRPDVYVIVLDGYGGLRGLREFLGIDNRPFVDSLRALGFVVPDRVVANYTQTALSLPSFLNMTLLSPLPREMDVDRRAASRLYHLIEHNRALRVARSAGYRVLGFPAAWWPGSARFADAHVTFTATSPLRIRRWASGSQLRQEVWNRSILRTAGDNEGEVIPDVTIRSIRALAQVPNDSASTFAFAHLMIPHWPYTFDRDCTMIDRARRSYGRRAHKPGYDNQLACTNTLILRLVRDLLAHSSTPPVIVLQGDHGTQVTDPLEPPNGVPTAAQMRERFDTFGAYYLPGDSGAALQRGVAVVNVLRYVLARYVGADLAPVTDSVFYSTQRKPYRFVPVDTGAFFTPGA